MLSMFSREVRVCRRALSEIEDKYPVPTSAGAIRGRDEHAK